MTLRIKITLETERIMTLRRRVKRKIWCAECGAETDFVSDEDVRNLLQKSEKNIQIENLHKFQTTEGTTLICLESLLKDRAGEIKNGE